MLSLKIDFDVIKLEFRRDFKKRRDNSIQVRVVRRELERKALKEVFKLEMINGSPSLRGEDWLLRKEGRKRYTLFFGDKNPSEISVENTMRFVIAQEAPEIGGVLIHSSSAHLEGKGFCFIGSSGAGKTTIVKLFKKFKSLNDDLNLLFFSEEKLCIFPLPILSKKIFYPIVDASALFILNKSQKDEVIKIKKGDAFAEMISCLPFIHLSQSSLRKGFEILEKILDYVPLYRLNFSLNGKVEEKIFNLISGKGKV